MGHEFDVVFLEINLTTLLCALALVQRNRRIRILLLVSKGDFQGNQIWSFRPKSLSAEHREWVRDLVRVPIAKSGMPSSSYCYIFSFDLIRRLRHEHRVVFATAIPEDMKSGCIFGKDFFSFTTSTKPKKGGLAAACWIAEAVSGFEKLDPVAIQKYINS